MFSLKLFGGVSLFGDDGPLTGPATQRRRLALLALLAAAPDGGVSREKLIGYLWAETGSEQARRFLADSVYSLRKALGQEAILAQGDNLRLNPEVIRSDVTEFREALARGDRLAAAALYKGPFLDGFFVPDASESERWSESERERYAREFAHVLEALAEEREREGDLRAAVEWWRRLAAHDPYSSRVALRLMQALEAAGDPGGALQHARMHEALLREALEIEPDAEVLALAERLRQTGAGKEIGLVRPALERARDEDTGTPPEESSVAGTDANGAAAGSDRPATRSGDDLSFHRSRWRGSSTPGAVGIVAAMIGLIILGMVNAVYRSGPDRPPHSEVAAVQTTPTAETRSIAVLPFVDLSPDGDHEYFGDGMAEELIHALARVEGLRVAARTSAFSFKGENVPVPEIARRLQVGHVVEGSIRRSGERVRISVQLIDAGSGFPIWSQVYDRRISDIFAIQQEISRSVVAALRVQLEDVGNAQVQVAQRLPASVEAYEFYLRGLHLLKSGASRDALPRAIGLLEQAVAADPSYAAAHGMLASAYGLQAHFLPGPQHEALAKSRAAAQRGIELDSTRPEAWDALGNIAFAHEFEWDAAERHFRRAIALDPSYTFGRVALALCLHAQGRFDEALAEAQAARAADPLAPAVSTILGRILVNARQPDLAIHYLQEALQLSPLLDISHQQLGHAYLQKGMYGEAIAAMRRATELSGGRDAAQLAYAHAVAGEREAAVAIVQDLIDPARRAFAQPVGLAMAYIGLGDFDAAFRWLEQGFERRAPFMHAIKVMPAFDPLHTDPRWEHLLRRMNLQP
jgi:TolB-like protein/DNA-binding SARP family transcriptional activator/Tfp pilus assembly protein PilF